MFNHKFKRISFLFHSSQLRFDEYIIAVECILSENVVVEMLGSPASQALLQLLQTALEKCIEKGKGQ